MKRGCLVDRGANGCIIGSNMTVLNRTGRFIDLTGIEDHTVRELAIVEAACVMESHRGNVIIHIHQGAYMPDGKSILAPLQLESYGCTVQDKAKQANGGRQPYFQSKDGYRFPLAMRHGLMYVDVRPVREDEWGNLPHVYLTSSNDWDPNIFDHEVDPSWADQMEDDPVEEYYKDKPFDRFGELKDLEGEDNEPVTRSEVEANVTESIEDELVGSVIEYFIDGEIFHGDVDEADDTLSWGDWDATGRWHSYDVTQRRRSSRNKPRVDYKESKRQKKREPPGKTKTVTPSSSSSTGSSRPTVTTVTETDDEDEDSSDDEEPRTDYNNPSKSTEQNDERQVEGGPYIGKPSEIDYEKLRMNFCGAPVDKIKKTFQNTTQLGRLGAVKGLKLWKRHKAPNPALNIPRRNEPVATDTIYGPGCPAVDNGSTAAQFFVGRKSGFCAVEGLGRSDKRFPVALMNHIRRYGAMDQIISDNAKAQISSRVEEILNALMIKDCGRVSPTTRTSTSPSVFGGMPKEW